jgi:hypothetical protein
MIKLPVPLLWIRDKKILLRFPAQARCGFSLLSNVVSSKMARELLEIRQEGSAGPEVIASEIKRRYDEIFSTDADGATYVHLQVKQAVDAVPGIESLLRASHLGGSVLGYPASEVASAAIEILAKFELLIEWAAWTVPTRVLRWRKEALPFSEDTISLRFEPHQEHAYFLMWEARIALLAERLAALDDWTSESSTRRTSSSGGIERARFELSNSVDAAGDRIISLTQSEAWQLSDDIDEALTRWKPTPHQNAYRRPVQQSVSMYPEIADAESVKGTAAYLASHRLTSKEFQVAALATSRQISDAVARLLLLRGVDLPFLFRPGLEAVVGPRSGSGVEPEHGEGVSPRQTGSPRTGPTSDVPADSSPECGS